MRVVIQRVSHAEVAIAGSVVAAIDKGYLVLCGYDRAETEVEIQWLLQKLTQLRLFGDDEGKMNHNIQEIGGSVLLVSQFTLFASTKKGNRPGFTNSCPPSEAEKWYNYTIEALRGIMGKERVQTGIFGADMQVSLCNDGPVTLCIDTKNKE